MHVVDEAADAVLPRDEGARLDPGDRLAHVGGQVVEGLGSPVRLEPGLRLEGLLEVVVGERERVTDKLSLSE